MKTDLKIKLYLDKRDLGIAQPGGTYGTQNFRDYYLNINLNRKFKIIDEYVDIQIDPLRVNMERQLINPWFIEFGFFESIKGTGISGTTQFSDTFLQKQESLIKKADIYSITINK